MRRRLTAAFILLGIVFTLTFAAVRAVSLGDLVRDQARDHLVGHARVIGEMVARQVAAGEPVADLGVGALIDDDQRLVLRRDGKRVVVVTGTRFRDDVVPLTGMASVGAWSVQIDEDPARTASIVRSNVRDLLLVALTMLAMTSFFGAWLASRISRPFHQLAGAAGELGRGRFELDLPKSRMPEVRAIAAALDGSARSLEHDLLRDSEVLTQASHEIRTPLTTLRMELEDWALRDDLPAEVREGATRGVAQVDRVDAITGGLISHARSRSIRADAQGSLLEVAHAVVDRWADALTGGNVRVFVEGDPDVRLTPGPLEQLLDHVLLAITAESPREEPGEVRLTFLGEPDQVRVTVLAADGSRPGDEAELARSAELARAVGGMVTGDPSQPGGLVVRLPIR